MDLLGGRILSVVTRTTLYLRRKLVTRLGEGILICVTL